VKKLKLFGKISMYISMKNDLKVTRAHSRLIYLALKKDDIISRKGNTYLLGSLKLIRDSL